MKRYGSLRWVLLAAGVIAILGLTGMNVYSLYALHENTLVSSRENKKLQIAEFSDKIRYRFFKEFEGLGTADIHRLQDRYHSTGSFTKEVNELLHKASTDSIYNGIYFIPSGSGACRQEAPVAKYDPEKDGLQPVQNYPQLVCDGMGIARTQVKSMVKDYQYNNKVIFNSHRSITIVLIDPVEHHIFGYFVMPFDQHYLRNTYLPKVLVEKFGVPKESGMEVWLRDWTNNRIIASNKPEAAYNREKMQFGQTFPDIFHYWRIEVAFTDESLVAASQSSLIQNLIVLGAAMLLLLGALVFMFISAQKERALAEQQADFLANVTHELKTPLSVMQAAGENLADGRVQDRKRLKNYGSHIFSEAIRLRKMIDKLLDVAKADAGDSIVEPKPVYLGDTVNAYLENHTKFIRSKGFTLETSIEDNLPPVKIDQGNLNTILSNLIDNALKYSGKEKHLSISITQKKDQIELCIRDRGVGIDKKDISNIFNKFFRVEDSLTAKTKGHGLGLSIVKNLVTLNNGQINVESTPGEGSAFVITFPILAGHTKEVQTSPAPAKNDSPIKESENYVS